MVPTNTTDVRAKQLALARELEQKLLAVVDTNRRLREFETNAVGVTVWLAFGAASAEIVTDWRKRLDAVAAGTRTV